MKSWNGLPDAARLDLMDAYLRSNEAERTIFYSTLLDKYQSLSGQIDSLAATIIKLGMRGTEDVGACAVAEMRLTEMKAAQCQ